MHALARTARESGDGRRLEQAVELARAAHAGFARPVPGGGKVLVWKASIDLSRALVPSPGLHDPLDGLITCLQLRAAAGDVLERETRELRAMCAGSEWATADPLGVGGLLFDAARLGALMAEGRADEVPLLAAVLRSAERGLELLDRRGGLGGPAPRRLAFRELGLAIGLREVPRLETLESASFGRSLATLRRFLPWAEHLTAFWLDPASRRSETWRDHLDINAVTLATSLAPNGFLSA